MQKPSKAPNWTNGEILYRIGVSPLFIEWTLKDNYENWQILVDPKLMTGSPILKTHESFIRSHARSATLLDLAIEHEHNCNRILSILKRIADTDLQNVLIILDDEQLLSGQVTVGELFHFVKLFFNAYRKQVDVGK